MSLSGTEITIGADQFSGVSSSESLDLSEATLRIVRDPTDTDESKTYVVYRWPDPGQR